jgi:hypothetical protein
MGSERKCVICGGELTGQKRKYCSGICQKKGHIEDCNRYVEKNREKVRKTNRRYKQQNQQKVKKASNLYYEKNKEAKREYSKLYRENNKETVKETRRKYVEKNKEVLRKKSKKWGKRYRENNKDKVKGIKKKYYQNNKEKINEHKKQYYKNNKEKLAEKSKEYRRKNKEHISKKQKEWRENNKEKVKDGQKIYRKNNKEKIKKYKSRHIYKLHSGISRSINYYLKLNNICKNRRKWEDLVGYSTQDLKEYLEKLFQPGMTWKNYGKKWHIDHIAPVSFFKFTSTNDVEFRYCWSLYNLQPLWKKENLEKNDKITLWGKEIDVRYIDEQYFDKLT